MINKLEERLYPVSKDLIKSEMEMIKDELEMKLAEVEEERQKLKQRKEQWSREGRDGGPEEKQIQM